MGGLNFVLHLICGATVNTSLGLYQQLLHFFSLLAKVKRRNIEAWVLTSNRSKMNSFTCHLYCIVVWRSVDEIRYKRVTFLAFFEAMANTTTKKRQDNLWSKKHHHSWDMLQLQMCLKNLNHLSHSAKTQLLIVMTHDSLSWLLQFNPNFENNWGLPGCYKKNSTISTIVITLSHTGPLVSSLTKSFQAILETFS